MPVVVLWCPCYTEAPASWTAAAAVHQGWRLTRSKPCIYSDCNEGLKYTTQYTKNPALYCRCLSRPGQAGFSEFRGLKKVHHLISIGQLLGFCAVSHLGLCQYLLLEHSTIWLGIMPHSGRLSYHMWEVLTRRLSWSCTPGQDCRWACDAGTNALDTDDDGQ